MSPDPHGLRRFLDAQSAVYARVTAELTAGKKTTHWMWFVFPQMRGLGASETARHFGIAAADEALAYLQHPVLGARLAECTDLVLAVTDRTALALFGSPDDLKFISSMTLFEHVAPQEPRFAAAISRYAGGRRDARTLSLLR